MPSDISYLPELPERTKKVARASIPGYHSSARATITSELPRQREGRAPGPHVQELDIVRRLGLERAAYIDTIITCSEQLHMFATYWDPVRYTFMTPWEEMSPTLEDVHDIFGLLIRGERVHIKDPPVYRLDQCDY